MRNTLLERASAALGGTLLVVACGGGKPAGPAVSVPATGASASSSAAPGATTSTPPPGLPAMAAMPAPGVTGSKKAKKRADASLAACGGGAGSARTSRDPAAEVKRLGDACAATSKMRPVGAAIRGSQADKDAHQEHKLRVESGKCYRVYFAHDESVKDAVVVLRDSAGDLVTESPGAAMPDDGAICFTTADEVTILVGVGAGKGTYAVQVFGD